MGVHLRPTSSNTAFHNCIIGNFMVYTRSTWNKFIAAIRASRKFRMIFYNFCYYFWDQHCWWTEKNISGNDFFIFYKFPLLSTVLLLPLPYRCSGVAEYACCVNKLRQNANTDMTSYCGVINSVYPVTMTTIRHCSMLEFGKGASNQALAPGITRPLHATGRSVWFIVVEGFLSIDAAAMGGGTFFKVGGNKCTLKRNYSKFCGLNWQLWRHKHWKMTSLHIHHMKV